LKTKLRKKNPKNRKMRAPKFDMLAEIRISLAGCRNLLRKGAERISADRLVHP